MKYDLSQFCGKSITEIAGKLLKDGFQHYGSFNEGKLQHDTYTCTNGGVNCGQVVDVYHDWNTGQVSKIESCSQFK